MSDARRASTLARAAHLYYVEGLTQAAVAKRLHTTRSNVSRMLTAAREQRIVRIRVVHPLARHERLEEALTTLFPSLREAHVLSADAVHDEDEELDGVGRLAARWLEDHLTDGQHIILSWGRTLAAMVRAVEVDDVVDVTVGQIGGDLQIDDPSVSSHELVRGLAAALGGTFEYVHAPALCPLPSVTTELRRAPGIADQLARAAAADVALVGIGGFDHGFSANLLGSAHLTDEESAALRALRPVGDIGARFFDADGSPVHGPLTDRVLGLDLEELRGVGTVVGVAAGREKAAGILGALRGGHVSVLVCDQAAAAGALHLHRQQLNRDKELVA